MKQKNIEQKEINIPEETHQKLLNMGFQLSKNKKNLYNKILDDNKWAHWDFSKTSKGRFYVSNNGGGFEKDKEAKQRPEYLTIRNNKNEQKTTQKPSLNTITKINPPHQSNNDIIELRGTEQDITTLIQQRNLDLIIKASPDQNKPGEDILYYDKKIGKFNLIEPSVELIDIISAQMGNITVEILEKGIKNHTDPSTGDTYQTYYCITKAKDMLSGSEGIGSAEEIIDYDEMRHQKKTFSLTKAIRKSERNAKERLIPVPRKAMVELVKEIMTHHKKQSNK